MSSCGYVGPPRLLSTEVLVSSEEMRDKHFTLRMKVEDKESKNPVEYDIYMQPSTLDAVISSFEKIKNQLQILTDKENES